MNKSSKPSKRLGNSQPYLPSVYHASQLYFTFKLTQKNPKPKIQTAAIISGSKL